MSATTEDWRLIVKYSTISGETPTIPITDDHTDGTWIPTDIYIGEFFLNVADDLLYVRTDGGIIPVGATSATFSIINNYMEKTGGTFSGRVYAPTFSSNRITTNVITATEVLGGYIYGTFSGDGSNITGISAAWNGGTVSGSSSFTNQATFTNDTYLNGTIKSSNSTITINPNLKVLGYITASNFYGDGSGLTNLPTGTYSDTYTTGATLSGNEIIFTRNDASTYEVDLTPILATSGVYDAYWSSADTTFTIELNDGTLIEAPINDLGDISAGVFTANEIYANNIYGYLIGTVSGDIYTIEATFSLPQKEAIFLRTDGNTYSLDLSELYDENKDTWRFITSETEINKSFQVITNDLYIKDTLIIEAGDTTYDFGSGSVIDDALLQSDTIWIDGTLDIRGILVNSGGEGAAGTSGTSGKAGTSGSSGVSGTSGSSGTNGLEGSSGTSGSSGINGTSGSSGINGTSGSSGINGTSGSSGINGTSGSSGINGTSGSSGINGTSGSSGINGTSGSSGTTPINPISLNSGSPNSISTIWSGTLAQYQALSPTYSNTTIYFVE